MEIVLKSEMLILFIITCFICGARPQPEDKDVTYEAITKMHRDVDEHLTKAARLGASIKEWGNYPLPPPGLTVKRKDYDNTYHYLIETHVSMIVKVTRIDVMDVESQTLKFATEVAFAWIDDKLKWNYTDFPIKSREIIHGTIWTPRFIPENVIEYEYIPSWIKPTVTVMHDGRIVSKVAVSVIVPCDVNVLTYPFDTHHCHLSLAQGFDKGKRMYLASILHENDSMSEIFTQKHQHREWEVMSIKQSSEDNGETFHLQITVKRKALFYAVVLMMPCLVLNLLSFLMFVIDVDGTSRADLALNLILSFFVLLVILIDYMPPSGGEVPLLGFYVAVSTTVILFIMLGSLVLIKLHKMKVAGKPVPSILKCLAVKLTLFKRKTSNKLKFPVSNTDCEDNNKFLQSDSSKKEQGASERLMSANDDNSSNTESEPMDYVIANLNFILFAITAVLHTVLLIGVCVVWIKES